MGKVFRESAWKTKEGKEVAAMRSLAMLG